jgi:hypothetical protein
MENPKKIQNPIIQKFMEIQIFVQWRGGGWVGKIGCLMTQWQMCQETPGLPNQV